MKKIKELLSVIPHLMRDPRNRFKNWIPVFTGMTRRNAGIIVGAFLMVIIAGFIFRDKIPFFSATGNDPVAYWKFDEGIL